MPCKHKYMRFGRYSYKCKKCGKKLNVIFTPIKRKKKRR